MSYINNNNTTITSTSSSLVKQHQATVLNSPLQKDSGIDDCSPLSYEDEHRSAKGDVKPAVCVYPPCPVPDGPATPQDSQHMAEPTTADCVVDLTEDNDTNDGVGEDEVELLPEDTTDCMNTSSSSLIIEDAVDHSQSFSLQTSSSVEVMNLADIAKCYSNPKTSDNTADKQTKDDNTDKESKQAHKRSLLGRYKPWLTSKSSVSSSAEVTSSTNRSGTCSKRNSNIFAAFNVELFPEDMEENKSGMNLSSIVHKLDDYIERENKNTIQIQDGKHLNSEKLGFGLCDLNNSTESGSNKTEDVVKMETNCSTMDYEDFLSSFNVTETKVEANDDDHTLSSDIVSSTVKTSPELPLKSSAIKDITVDKKGEADSQLLYSDRLPTDLYESHDVRGNGDCHYTMADYVLTDCENNKQKDDVVINGITSESLGKAVDPHKVINRLYNIFNGAKLENANKKEDRSLGEDLLNPINKVECDNSDKYDVIGDDNEGKNGLDSSTLGRNIFDLLSSQGTTDKVEDSISPNGLTVENNNITVVLNDWSTGGNDVDIALKEKKTAPSTGVSGNDFESATGESQFNFYDSNEVVPTTDSMLSMATKMDTDVVYNDCYLGVEGSLARSNSGVFSSQNVETSSCGSQGTDCESNAPTGGETPSKYIKGDDTPSKYAILSSQETSENHITPMKEAIYSEPSSTPKVSPSCGSSLDTPRKEGYQTEFAKFLQEKTPPANIKKPVHSFSNSSTKNKSVNIETTIRKRGRPPKKKNPAIVNKCDIDDGMEVEEDIFSSSSTVLTVDNSRLAFPASSNTVNNNNTRNDVAGSSKNPSTCNTNAMLDTVLSPSLPIVSTVKKRYVMSSRQEKCLFTQHQRLALLRKKVLRLIHIVFPQVEYPRYFKNGSFSVEVFVEQIMGILRDAESSSGVGHHKGHHHQVAIPNERTCCEVKVVLCKSPLSCLRNLRKKIIRFLKCILPNLQIAETFDITSDLVDDLLKNVIHYNEQTAAATSSDFKSTGGVRKP